MIPIQRAAHAAGTATAGPLGRLLVAGFLLALLATAGAQNGMPGTEEFGLSAEGLFQAIERVEALIARCMGEAGFEYVAVDYNTVRRGMVADKSLPGFSEQQFIARHGYGIATLYTGAPPQLADDTTPARIGLGQQNIRIFDSLGAADQVAYNRTLFSENTDATFAVALEAEDFSRTGGCTRSAIEQVFDPEQLTFSYFNPLDTLIEQDARMVEALGRFAECIRAQGFDYGHPDEVEDAIRNRLYAITGGLPLEALSVEAKSALEALQQHERAASVAAFDCQERILEPVEDRVERDLYANPPR